MSRLRQLVPGRRGLALVTLAALLTLPALLLVPAASVQSADKDQSARLEIKPGDHICIIGNTLADRMQHDGWLETYLHSRFPKHELVIRNLGFSGDELTVRLRSANFGTPRPVAGRRQPGAGAEPPGHPQGVPRQSLRDDQHQADVVFAFFGYNESFAGKDGLDEVQEGPRRLHQAHAGPEVQRQDAPRGWSCSRRSPTRTCKAATCPTARRTTSGSKLYTAAMAEVAKANGVAFVDLFHPTLTLYAKADEAAHDQRHPPERARQPGSSPTDHRPGSVPGEPQSKRDPKRWRSSARPSSTRTSTGSTATATVDGYSIYGGRADLRVRRRPDQPRGRPARDGSPRRDDRQPRQADLGRRAGQAT